MAADDETKASPGTTVSAETEAHAEGEASSEADATSATDAASATEAGDAADASGEAGVPTGRGRAGRVIAGLVIVALLVATCVLGYLLWQEQRQDALRQSAADEASRLVVQLATYDHTDVDGHLDSVVSEATPGFAERYTEVSEGLRELLASGEGTSSGTVVNAATESVDGDTAVVLVFLDQQVTNVTVPDGRVDSSRMLVTVQRDGDRWLLDDAQLI